MKHIINENNRERTYIITVLLIYLSYTIFHILKYPVYIDEASTYNDYTSESLYTIISTYNEPNNHVFFSIITKLFSFLPLDILVNLRLPNLLIGGATSFLTFVTLRKLVSFKATILPHVFLTFSYSVIFYSTFARGYMLVIFFSILCFYAILKMKEDFNNKSLILYSTATILGFYTIPIFLYVSLSLTIFLFLFFFKEKRKLISLVKFYFLIGLGVVTLYLPIFVNAGVDAVINNKWTKSLEFGEIISEFKNGSVFGIYDKLIGINSLIIIIVFLLVMSFLYFRIEDIKKRKIIIYIVLTFLLPFVFILSQRVIPGTRTWSYLIFPFTIGLAIIVEYIFSNYRINKLLVLLAIPFFILSQVYIFEKSHPNAGMEYDYRTTQLSNKLFDNNYSTYYFESEPLSFEEVVLKFVYNKNKKQFHYYNLSSQESIDWNSIECYIVPRNSELVSSKKLNNRKLLFKDGQISVYGK